MEGESLAIIAVLLVLIAVTARRGKYRFAVALAPLFSVPALHLLGWALRLEGYYVWFDLAGLLLGAGLCVAVSRSLPSRAAKWLYLVSILIFLTALLLAYSLNLGYLSV